VIEYPLELYGCIVSAVHRQVSLAPDVAMVERSQICWRGQFVRSGVLGEIFCFGGAFFRVCPQLRVNRAAGVFVGFTEVPVKGLGARVSVLTSDNVGVCVDGEYSTAHSRH